MFVVAARQKHPIELVVVSGYRTFDAQAALYDKYLHHGGNLAAVPGYSNHQSGVAVDLNTDDLGVYAWLERNAASFGFHRTVPSELWHWEYQP